MEKRTKRWGDRPDACWIRDLDGLHAIMPHLMNKRTDAEVYVNMEFDVTEALRYIEEKNRGEDELWGDRIFEKCGIRRDEGGDGGKTLEIRGKRRLSARDGGANYQQS